MELKAAIRLRATQVYRLLHGHTISMSPQQFLALAMPFGHQGGPKAEQTKVDYLSSLETWDSNPMLSVKESPDGGLQVGLHDGRHRALAALKRGDPHLAVDIVMSRKYAREHPGSTNVDVAKLVVEHGLKPEV